MPAALTNVQQLVSQRLDVLWRAEGAARNARDLLQTVQDLRIAARETTEVAAAATARSAELTVEVDGLSAASKAIEDVIKIITSIAGQTNLLALNATIEAARAGDAGRGFAVVANEVKDLARATAEATTDVSEQVAGIQASSSSVATGIQSTAIRSTAEIIGRLHTVQARMSEVLEIQAQMASAFEQG